MCCLYAIEFVYAIKLTYLENDKYNFIKISVIKLVVKLNVNNLLKIY